MHCRGGAGFDEPAAQVVDVEGFAELGAAWAVSERTAAVEPVGEDRWRVSVTSELDGRVQAVVSATVVVERLVPLPACGDGPGDATAPVFAVSDLSVEG